MGWCGIFLIEKLRLAFRLRSMSEDNLYSDFEQYDRFFEGYDKLRGDIDYIQEAAEEAKTFSAKTTAKMFNVIDALGGAPEYSDAVLSLYFLHKLGFEIEHHSEDKANLEALVKKGWKVIGQG